MPARVSRSPLSSIMTLHLLERSELPRRHTSDSPLSIPRPSYHPARRKRVSILRPHVRSCRVVEIRVEVDDIRSARRHVHFSLAANEECPQQSRYTRRKPVELILGDPDVAMSGVFGDGLEGIDPTGDVPDSEHADPVDLRWPQAAIAVAQNLLEKSRSIHWRLLGRSCAGHYRSIERQLLSVDRLAERRLASARRTAPLIIVLVGRRSNGRDPSPAPRYATRHAANHYRSSDPIAVTAPVPAYRRRPRRRQSWANSWTMRQSQAKGPTAPWTAL